MGQKASRPQAFSRFWSLNVSLGASSSVAATSRLLRLQVLKMRDGGACSSAAPGYPGSRAASLIAAVAAIVLLCLSLCVLLALVRVGVSPEAALADGFLWAVLAGSLSEPQVHSKAGKRTLQFFLDAVQKLKLRSILHLECGELHWMKAALRNQSLGIQSYLGVDECPVIVAANKQTYGGLPGVEFLQGNASTLEGRRVDAVVALNTLRDHFKRTLAA